LSDSTIKQKLQEMAQLAILANRISEVQEKNLKNYPFVFFNDVQVVRIDYDLGHAIDEKSKQINHRSFIAYYLTLNEESNQSFVDKRFLALETAIRSLFWKDVTLKVYFNTKPVYESKE